MQIYAAIDLKSGKCVRLTQGDPNQETVYSDSPVEMAQQWVELGTDWLHIVNLDGALNNPKKSAQNVEAVQTIAQTVDCPIQFGGGLRGAEDVRRALEWGIRRVVIGSLAAKRPDQMLALLAEFGPEQVALGLDVRDGKVATAGWQDHAEADPQDLLRYLTQGGLKHVIHTDISRDGMLTGANVAASAQLAETVNQQTQSNVGVIVSGGVASLDDVRQVKAAIPRGVSGMIIGKALYSGAIALPDALAISR